VENAEEKIMKKKIRGFSLLLVFASWAFSGCFSAWKGNEATLTLLLGNTTGRAAVPDQETLSYLAYIIELDGPTGRQSHTIETNTFSATVMPGYWRISVRALLNTTLYAKGESGADIIAGKNNTVEIKMEAQLYTVTFNGNGNTGGTPPEPMKQSYPCEAITLPKNPNMSKIKDDGPQSEYFEFDGWGTKNDGTGNNYKVDDSYTPDDNITLYAIWK